MPIPVTSTKIETTPIATAFGDTVCRDTVDVRSSVSATGQTSTQLMQVVHSSEMTVLTLSTLIRDGHAIAHLAQSIQLVGLRFILKGLSSAVIPSSAP